MSNIVIVGPYSREFVKKYDKISLLLENNEYQSIGCYLKDTKIGVVAENASFLSANDIASSDLRLNMDIYKEAIVIDTKEVVYSNGSKATALIAELVKKENKDENMGGMNKMKSFELKLIGLMGDCKAKLLPIDYFMKNNKYPELDLQLIHHEGSYHVVIGPESELYNENENIKENSIGIINPEELDYLLLSDEIKSSESIEIEFLEPEQLNNKIKLNFIGNKLLSSIKGHENGLSEEEYYLRMDHLNQIGCPEDIKKGILSNIKPSNEDLDPEDRNRIPSKGFQYIQQDKEFITVLAAYNTGLHVLLEGNKASGKNTLIEDIGFLLNQPIFELQVNAELNNTDILGMQTIEPVLDLSGETLRKLEEATPLFFEGINKPQLMQEAKYREASAFVLKSIAGGETRVTYQVSPLIKAMETGGILVLDEINTGHPSILSVLNPILDNRGRIDVPGYKSVVAHPNFRVFATMNKGYAGTMGMNSATHSRFVTLEVEPSNSIREILLKDYPDLNKELLDTLDKIYRDMVKGTRDKNATLSPDCINIRAFKGAVDLINAGLPVKAALNTIATSTQDDDERNAIRTIMKLHNIL